MADKRMFSKTIIDSDAFLDMPLSTQALYFHLSMRADDDGFINNPKKIMRMVGAGEDEIKVLLSKKFVIGFESGVIVIKHWKIHNYIRNDRYKPTVYQEEKDFLYEKDNKTYTLEKPSMSVGRQSDGQVVDDLDTQVRLDKVRLDKISLDKVRLDKISLDKISLDKISLDKIRKDIVDYLNEKTGKSFKSTSDKTKKLIEARLKEKFTVDDFKKVIDVKIKDWINDKKMNQFLRPETLFSNKFEGYLNQESDNNIPQWKKEYLLEKEEKLAETY